MTSNANTNVSVPNLAFPTSNVRGAFIEYSAFRTTSDITVSETGTITITYNPTAATNSKWAITREYVGDAQITFTITDAGQVQFSSVLLSGTGFSGKLTYEAKALLNA